MIEAASFHSSTAVFPGEAKMPFQRPKGQFSVYKHSLISQWSLKWGAFIVQCMWAAREMQKKLQWIHRIMKLILGCFTTGCFFVQFNLIWIGSDVPEEGEIMNNQASNSVLISM